MRELEAFVRERLDEGRLGGGPLPDAVAVAYRRVLAVCRGVREDGEDSDWWSWLTGADPLVKVGEYVFGADSVSSADDAARSLLASLAATWEGHPDFDPAWRRFVPPVR